MRICPRLARRIGATLRIPIAAAIWARTAALTGDEYDASFA